jgi:hypothetical protein
MVHQYVFITVHTLLINFYLSDWTVYPGGRGRDRMLDLELLVQSVNITAATLSHVAASAPFFVIYKAGHEPTVYWCNPTT